MSPSHLFRLTPAAAAICLLAHASAQAQTAEAPSAPAATASSPAAAPAPAKSGVSELTTVVVTGQRATGFSSAVVGIGAFRDQKPVDVPLTNSVVTRDVLDAQSAKSVGDAVRNTAGVTQLGNSSASYDNLAVRGIAMENRSSYRLDGSLPLISLVAIPMDDKERVEVLKGASSMYYGLVPPGGIVSFEMKRAGPKPVTSFSTTVNQYGGYDVSGDVGRRFGEDDKFGLRVNLASGKDDPGLKPYHGDRRLAAAAFDFRMVDNLTFKFNIEDYQKKSTEVAPTRVLGSLAALPKAPDSRVNLGGDWAVLDAKATNTQGRVDWGITDNWNITAEYGEAHASRSRSLPQFFLTNAETGDGSVQTGFLRNQRYVNKNSRLDLSGRLETWRFAHEITVGYTRNTRYQYGGDNYGTQGTTTGAAWTDATGVLRPGITTNLYNPTELPLYSISSNPTRGTAAQLTDRGVYAVDRIIFTKSLQLVLGLRRENFESYNVAAPEGSNTTPKYQISETTPNVSLIYKFTPDSSVYVSRLEGLDVGQTVVQDYFNGGSLLPAVKTKQIEAGFKQQLAGGFLVQGAFFQIDKAQPTTSATNFCGTTPAAAIAAAVAADPSKTLVVPQQYGPNLYCVSNLSNDGKLRYRGFELAASGDITRNFGVVISGMLMKAKITKDTSAPANNYEGKTPGNTPKATLSLFGEYRPDSVPGLGINAGAYYISRRPVYNNNTAYVPSTTLFSLGTRYKTKVMASDATFQVSIDNLLDKSYWSAGDSVNAQPSVAQGMPRIIRGTAKFDF
jgi:iron complex outermembrane receptor protein